MKAIRLPLFGLVAGLVFLLAACNVDTVEQDKPVTPPPAPTATVTAVIITSKQSTLKVNEVVTLSALVEGTNTPPQSVSWWSSDPKVASVSATGELKALASGSAVISATSTFNTTVKGAFNLSVTAETPPAFKVTSSAGNKVRAGDGPITLLVIKPNATDTISWRLSGDVLGKLSTTTGDSVTYTPPTTGSGTDTITATAGTLTASIDIEIEAPLANPSANRISGKIEDWTKTKTVLFTAITNQNETLANDRVSGDGLLEMTFNTPKQLADLDGSFDSDICSASNALRSEPALLKGAVVYDIIGTEEAANLRQAGAITATPLATVTVTQRSFVSRTSPLDGQGFVFRVYSETAGKIMGSCSFAGTTLRLEFNVTLASGWNLVEAIYVEGNNEFQVQTVPALAASMKLEAETETPPPPANIAPYAYLDVQAGYSSNEVLIDASYSYDPDGSITFWSLDMGDGTVLSSSTYGSIYNIYYFSYYYAAPGSYPVTLTVCDDDGECAYSYTTAYAY
jgi:PKD domain/Bacterial Ig-like domain (group 2)